MLPKSSTRRCAPAAGILDILLCDRLISAPFDGLVHGIHRAFQRFERIDARWRHGHPASRAATSAGGQDAMKCIISWLLRTPLSNRNWPMSFSITTARLRLGDASPFISTRRVAACVEAYIDFAPSNPDVLIDAMVSWRMPRPG